MQTIPKPFSFNGAYGKKIDENYIFVYNLKNDGKNV